MTEIVRRRGPIRMVQPQRRGPQVQAHSLLNERDLRNTLEALFKTYPEAKAVWPMTRTSLRVDLSDGRRLFVEYRYDAPHPLGADGTPPRAAPSPGASA